MLTDKEKQEVKEIIINKVHNLTCPMCKKQNFMVADGYFINGLHTKASIMDWNGQAIPTIGIICENCGFVSQHALGIIGIIDKIKNEEDEH